MDKLRPYINFLINDIVRTINNKEIYYTKLMHCNTLLIKSIFELTYHETEAFVDLLLEDNIKNNIVDIINQDIDRYNHLKNVINYNTNKDIICTYVITYSIYLEVYLIVKNKYFDVISLSY